MPAPAATEWLQDVRRVGPESTEESSLRAVPSRASMSAADLDVHIAAVRDLRA
jgi:hypothetical protein